MKNLIPLIFFVFACLVGSAQPDGQGTTVVDTPAFDLDFVATVRAQAKLENKYILLYFHTPNCPVCLNMEEGTFKSQALQNLIDKKYIFKTLDAKLDFDGIELSQKYELMYYPSMIILDNNGNLLDVLVGYFNPNNLIAKLSGLAR